MVLGALALLSVAIPWVVLALMGREVIPGSIELTDRLFALTLLITWVGLWLCAIAVSRAPRRMLLRALGTTWW